MRIEVNCAKEYPTYKRRIALLEDMLVLDKKYKKESIYLKLDEFLNENGFEVSRNINNPMTRASWLKLAGIVGKIPIYLDPENKVTIYSEFEYAVL